MRRRTSSSLIWCAAALLVFAGAGSVAHAQVLYGSLTGNVIDPADAAIPGAKVQAVNVNTGVTRQDETDARGAFLFNNLQLGTYKVTVEAKGFQTTVVSDVVVNANEVRRVDFNVAISRATQTVEVSANAAVLQTDKSDVHQVITAQQVTELPYSGGEGKNFQSLLYLVPGALFPATKEPNSEAGNPMRGQALQVNGVSSSANSYKMDGAPIIYPWLPVDVAYVPSTEAIETVNISTNSFDAEQGTAGGAATNVTIKSGTNEVHGSAFERNQNNDLVAVNNYFSHPGRAAKNIFNNYGFAFGGPVFIPKVINGKNKLFFFLDYQNIVRRQYASTPNMTLPTTAMRGGDFNGTGITIYDPLTGNPDGTGRQPFANNVIPTNRIDPASKTLAGLLPANLTRPNQYTSNYDAYGGTQYNRYAWDYKVNYDPTEKAAIWGRYSFSPISIPGTFALGAAEGDALGGAQPGVAGGRVQTTAAGFTYTISPTVLLDGNVGYTRQNIGANGDSQQGNYGLTTLGIPGTNGVGPDYAGIPGFQVTGIANIGNTSTGSPFLFRDNQYTTSLNLGKVSGSHNLRFGFEYDKAALNHFQPQGGTFGTARGTFGFNGSMTVLCNAVSAAGVCNSSQTPNANGNPANSWADFLLGYPNRMGKVTQFQDPNALRFSTWGLYARDQWQVTRNLTVTYGLRWEYYPIFSHNWYGAVRYDPATHNILIGGEGSTPWDTGASASKTGFAPRLGIAYRLGSKTVVRSGYGITVDPENMRNQRNSFPSVVNQDYPALTDQFVSIAGFCTQCTLRNGLPTGAGLTPNISQGVISPAPAGTTAATLLSTNYLPTISTGTFPADMNRGYIQSWNLFVQREISSSMTAEAGYVGTHAVHQTFGVNINGSAAGTNTTTARPLAPYLTGDLNSYEPFGNMTYNALQARVTKHIGSSVIGASYTFSRAIDNFNGTGSGTQGDNGDGSLFRAFPSSYALDKQLAGFDRTHTFVLYHVYNFPFGKGHKFLNHGVIAQIVGGFQIGGTLTRYSGLPFTVGSSVATNGGGQSQSATQINPVVQIMSGHDANSPYFDGTAFANPATGTLGTTGRNILRGPGLFNMDENVSRTFSFKDGRIKFQIVGEAFNLTNTASFNTPGSSGTTTFANPTLNAAGQITSYGNFSVITSTLSTQRQLQVSAYLRF
ncbi:MAG: TonB-dependent receptor [Acidobacteriia bacterium]|nr:TonB-dependent receptor [Terriglobia bacterium]